MNTLKNIVNAAPNETSENLQTDNLTTDCYAKIPSRILAAAEFKFATEQVKSRARNRHHDAKQASMKTIPAIERKPAKGWAALSPTVPQIYAVLKPDLREAEQFLKALGGETAFTFQTFSDREELKRKFTGNDGKDRAFDPFAKVLHGTLAEHAAELAGLNNAGGGVFVMVNQGDGVVHEGYKTCRTKSNVTAVRALFVDLDGSPLPPLMNAARSPDIIIESSPLRWHGYWLGIVCPVDRFKALQQALAAKFNGDMSVCDLPRVMRLPGFYHQKGNPFMTHAITLPAKEMV